jgi:hypothetical protein
MCLDGAMKTKVKFNSKIREEQVAFQKIVLLHVLLSAFTYCFSVAASRPGGNKPKARRLRTQTGSGRK